MMISFARHQLPSAIIQHAVWLYGLCHVALGLRWCRQPGSHADDDNQLRRVSFPAMRRRWVNHFGPTIAARLRKRRPKPCTTWHLDEVYLKIDGRMVYLWRAVDAEGEGLDGLVQSKRNKPAALKLMRKLLKKYAFVPDRLVTDDLRSYGAAVRDLGIEAAMSAGDGRTIGPRIRINQLDDGSARCNVSRAPVEGPRRGQGRGVLARACTARLNERLSDRRSGDQ
jgi:hypothetical protein